MTRWMSCEVVEVERSISVFYGNADSDFVRVSKLPQRCSRRSTGNSRRGDGRNGEARGEGNARLGCLISKQLNSRIFNELLNSKGVPKISFVHVLYFIDGCCNILTVKNPLLFKYHIA